MVMCGSTHDIRRIQDDLDAGRPARVKLLYGFSEFQCGPEDGFGAHHKPSNLPTTKYPSLILMRKKRQQHLYGRTMRMQPV